jgi:AcrR family transcriptional regulator
MSIGWMDPPAPSGLSLSKPSLLSTAGAEVEEQGFDRLSPDGVWGRERCVTWQRPRFLLTPCLMSLAKRRLSPEASRSAALDAARDLLLEAGPQAVTLKAVAARMGRTHANLLHHFGSASGLQKALAESMAGKITAEIGAAVLKARAGEGSPREVVDMTFDAFENGGGALASWMMLSGNDDALDPILQAIHRLMDQLGSTAADDTSMRRDTLNLVLIALGDALLGAQMAGALGLPHGTARDIATEQLAAAIANRKG